MLETFKDITGGFMAAVSRSNPNTILMTRP
jgi:hypothetical protein